MQEDSYRGSCAVRGALPPWLRGTLLRSGPALWEVGERQLRHLNDGTLAWKKKGRGDKPERLGSLAGWSKACFGLPVRLPWMRG